MSPTIVATFALGLTLGLTLVASACTGSHPQEVPEDTAPCYFTIEWGERAGGAFVPFHDGAEAGVILGFQGFRYLQTSVRLQGTSASDAFVRFQVTLDGHPTSAQEAGRFHLVTGDDGALYADAVQLFFNDVPMPEIVGHSAEVIVIGTAGKCTGKTSVTLKLVTGGCMSADGGTECADAGR